MSKSKTKRRTREKEVLAHTGPKETKIVHPAVAAAWKEGDRTIRCTFFEATGRTDCPFHRLKGMLYGIEPFGLLWLYAAKRTKRGIRGRYKRRKR